MANRQEANRKRANQWCKDNREHRSLYWKEKRRVEKALFGKTKNSEQNRKSRLKLKIEVVEKMGGKCTCCGETEIEFLTVDHINNDGVTDRKNKIIPKGGASSFRYIKQNNYPPGFQILCFNCNYSKHLGNGICVHQRC